MPLERPIHRPAATAAVELLKLWRGSSRLFLLCAGLVIISSASSLIPAVSSAFLVDNVIGTGRWDRLPFVAIGVGASVLIGAAVSVAASRLIGISAQLMIARTRRD